MSKQLEAEAKSEELRMWLEDVAGMPARVRWSAGNCSGVYAKCESLGRPRPSVRVDEIRPRAGVRWHEAVVSVPRPAPHFWRHHGGGKHASAGAAVGHAVTSALGHATTDPEFRSLLEGIAERLRAQREVVK